MPRRRREIVDGEYYHILTRGNDRKRIFRCRNDFILLRRKPRAFKPGDECAGCSRSIMRPMGFLLRRIPPTGEWKLRALARRASFILKS